MPRAGTRSASSDDSAWLVPESLRPELALRYGPVLSGAEADCRLVALDLFGACGDRVTLRSIELGHPPLVGIVDYKTQRSEPIDPGAFAPLAARQCVRVKNPPGMLTQRLRSAVRRLVAGGGGLIEVDGEEDLGSLALVESLPAGPPLYTASRVRGSPSSGSMRPRRTTCASSSIGWSVGRSTLEIRILEERANPLLHRREYRFEVTHATTATPKREEVRAEIAKLVQAPKDRVIIERMHARFGTAVSRGDANVYESVDHLKKITREHILVRHGLKEKAAKGPAAESPKSEAPKGGAAAPAAPAAAEATPPAEKKE